MRKRNRTLAQEEQRVAYWMLGPTVVAVLSIVLFPVLWNILLSLRHVRLLDLRNLSLFNFNLTLRNFERVFTYWGFFSDLRVTIIYSILGAFLSTFLGLMAAQLLNVEFRGRNFLRTLFVFPYIAPMVTVAFVWRLVLLSPHMGVLNALAVDWGLFSQPVAFLSQRPLALFSVIIFEGWRYFPFVFLFISARMQAIPDELYEAASIDGATLSQKFFYITLPQLKYVLATAFLLRFIWSFNKFDDVFMLTSGTGGTRVLPIKVYEFLVGEGDIGAAAALATILFLVLAIFLIVYFKYIMREGEEE